MANEFTTSMGYGIGLQAKPEQYADIAQENIRYQRAQEDARRKKEEADKKRLADDMGKFNVMGVDPIYNEGIALRAAKVKDRLQSLYNTQQYGNKLADKELNDAINDFQIYTGNAKLSTDTFGKGFKFAGEHADTVDPNADLVEAYRESVALGRPSERLAGILGNEQGFIGMDESRIYSPKAPKPLDYIPQFEKEVSPIFSKGKTTREEGGEMVASGGTSFDKAANMNLVEQRLRDPNSEIGRAALAAHGGNYEAAKKTLYDNLRSRFKPEYESTVKRKESEKLSSLGSDRFKNDKVAIQYNKLPNGVETIDFQSIQPKSGQASKEENLLDFTVTGAGGKKEALTGLPLRYTRKEGNDAWDLEVIVYDKEGGSEVRTVPAVDAVNRISGKYGFAPGEVMGFFQPEGDQGTLRTTGKGVQKQKMEGIGTPDTDTGNVTTINGVEYRVFQRADGTKYAKR